jgi:hypothetical protein
MAIQQEPTEPPVPLLQRLKDALQMTVKTQRYKLKPNISCLDNIVGIWEKIKTRVGKTMQ